MYQFIKSYYSDWFPELHSYVAFNTRINNLAYVLQLLSESLMKEFIPENSSDNISLLDSMPIITCSGKREGRVAKQITDKSYCSTKNLWYYGVKLHTLGSYNKGYLPHPEGIVISKASENDLNVFKDNWATLKDKTFFGDKYGSAEIIGEKIAFL